MFAVDFGGERADRMIVLVRLGQLFLSRKSEVGSRKYAPCTPHEKSEEGGGLRVEKCKGVNHPQGRKWEMGSRKYLRALSGQLSTISSRVMIFPTSQFRSCRRHGYAKSCQPSSRSEVFEPSDVLFLLVLVCPTTSDF